MTVLATPYRLGSTSYVWPADLLSNVRSLGPLVDDVEMVLFEVDGRSNLPDVAMVNELNRLADVHDLTYTVHLALDLSLATPLSLEMAAKVIAGTRDLAPWAYIVHLDGRAVEGEPAPSTLARWQDDARRALKMVAAMAGGPERLCVENLENYAPEAFVPLLAQVPVSLCIDVGHLWLTGRDPLPYLAEHLDRTRVIHLHGVGERDHQSLDHQGAGQVAPVLDLLAAWDFCGVLTLEVFNTEAFSTSRRLLAELVHGER
jgi:sugar phosphate isomerase/epimerase